jgi:hypothetical protein
MFVGVGEVTPPAGGPAAAFCAWVRHLGEEARLLIPLAALPPDPDVRRMVGELGAEGVDVFVNKGSPGQYLTGAQLIHMDAALLLDSPGANPLRTAVDAARRQGALLSLLLGKATRDRGADAVAYELAGIRPDIVFATGSAAAELGGSLEGIASIPVIELDSGGCSVYGRRLPALQSEHDADALAAAFCVAFVEGATPVEAAGRAVLVASGR